MNRLEHWHEADVIQLDMSEVAQQEAGRDGDQVRSSKAYSYIASETLADTPEEKELLQQIEKILFPTGAKTPNEWHDVEIVFNAKKYFTTLITNDGGSRNQPGGILGHAQELYEKFGIRVMRDNEAVALVEQQIRERDEIAKSMAMTTGEPLPEWVGRD